MSLASVTIPFPSPLSSHEPTNRPALTEAENSQLKAIVDYFNHTDFELPLSAPVESTSYLPSFLKKAPAPQIIATAPLNEIEKCYLSKEQFLRCLRATKWHQEAAIARAMEIMVWRRESKVESLTYETIKAEAATGKEYVMGYDHHSRPVLYMHPNRQNTLPSASQIDFVIYTLERAIDLLPPTIPATETICLAIDLDSKDPKTGKSLPPASISQSKKVLTILQTYNPERLGKAILISVPNIFRIFYNLISAFIDPVTKEKISFGEDPLSFVSKEQLVKEFNGEVNFQFDAETYFPALDKLCAERKAEKLVRWRENGRICGISEEILSGARLGE